MPTIPVPLGDKIMLMGADGSNAMQWSMNEGEAAGLPQVSPDGRYIVLSLNRTGGPHLWRFDLDGKNPMQLTNSASDRWDNPDFSPDGKWVFYSKRSAERGIWRVSIDGGKPEKLEDTTDWATSPTASPDGKMLAYFYYEPNTTPAMGIAIVSHQGGDVKQRIGTAAKQARWSDDSRSIIYVKSEAGVSNLWSQPVSGGPARQITHFNSEQIEGFSLSRDGKQMVIDRGTRASDVVLIRGER